MNTSDKQKQWKYMNQQEARKQMKSPLIGMVVLMPVLALLAIWLLYTSDSLMHLLGWGILVVVHILGWATLWTWAKYRGRSGAWSLLTLLSLAGYLAGMAAILFTTDKYNKNEVMKMPEPSSDASLTADVPQPPSISSAASPPRKNSNQFLKWSKVIGIAAVLVAIVMVVIARTGVNSTKDTVADKGSSQISMDNSLINGSEQSTAQAQATAYNQKGVALFNQGKNDEAIAEFSNAIQVYPNYPAAYTNRGIVYIAKAQYDTAITDFNDAIKLNPNYALAYSNRGLAYIYTQRYTEAIVDLNTSLEIDMKDDIAWNNLGVAYEELGETDMAGESYDSALEINPDNEQARNNSEGLKAGGNPPGALAISRIGLYSAVIAPAPAWTGETFSEDLTLPSGTSVGGVGITQSSLSLTGVWISNHGPDNEYGLLMTTGTTYLDSVTPACWFSATLVLTETSTSGSIGGLHEEKPVTFTGVLTTMVLKSDIPGYTLGDLTKDQVSGTRSDLAVNLLWNGINFHLGGSGNYLEGVTTLYQPSGTYKLVEVRPISGSYKTWKYYFWLKKQ